MATLPSNLPVGVSVPTVGFIAHLDTSPDMSGRHVKPRIVEAYPGGDIELNKDENVVLSPSQFPELNNYIGQDLIVTDGTTLLGADDKAGIAEIISAVEYLQQHPEIKHGDVRIAFNPDEEIGQGAHKFDVKLLALTGLILWTVAKSANSNMRTSMPLLLALHLLVATYTPVMQSTR